MGEMDLTSDVIQEAGNWKLSETVVAVLQF